MPRCHLCCKNHQLQYCPVFQNMDVATRIEEVRNNKMCTYCLAHTHLRYECDSQNFCEVCGQGHHTMLHPHWAPQRVFKTKITNTTNTRFRCHLCNRSHQLQYCTVFQGMSVITRRKVVARNQMCTRCLAHTHSKNVCDSQLCCQHCGEGHHTMLHLDRAVLSRSRPKKTNTRSNQTNPKPPVTVIPVERAILVDPRPITPLIRVRLHHGEHSQWMTLMVHTESDKSLLLRSAVSRFKNFTAVAVTEGSIGTFLIYGNKPITWSTRIGDELDVSHPTPVNDPKLLEHFNNLNPLAHPKFHEENNIDGYIARTFWSKLTLPTVIATPNCPTAQATCFGWVISGEWTGCECVTHERRPIQDCV